MKRIVILFVILLTFVAVKPVSAGFQEGLAAAERGDYATALKEWRRLAEKGHSGALFNLGLMYANGQGVERNAEWAALLFRQAAELNHAFAQMNLAVALKAGKGVPQNHAESVVWFRKVAQKGHLGAQFNLAIAYLEGLGVERDPARAAHWFAKSAEGGLNIAQYNLARAFETGDGMAKNNVLALKWYALAALTFPPGEGRKAAIAARDKLNNVVTKAQAQKAEAGVRDWIRKHTDKSKKPNRK
jgi:uncharacterized protein